MVTKDDTVRQVSMLCVSVCVCVCVCVRVCVCYEDMCGFMTWYKGRYSTAGKHVVCVCVYGIFL